MTSFTRRFNLSQNRRGAAKPISFGGLALLFFAVSLQAAFSQTASAEETTVSFVVNSGKHAKTNSAEPAKRSRTDVFTTGYLPGTPHFPGTTHHSGMTIFEEGCHVTHPADQTDVQCTLNLIARNGDVTIVQMDHYTMPASPAREMGVVVFTTWKSILGSGKIKGMPESGSARIHYPANSERIMFSLTGYNQPENATKGNAGVSEVIPF